MGDFKIEKKVGSYEDLGTKQEVPYIRFTSYFDRENWDQGPLATVYPNGNTGTKNPHTEVDLYKLRQYDKNWFRKRLLKDPLTKRDNFPGLSPAQYSEAIGEFIQQGIPEQFGTETMEQPYADILKGLGFRREEYNAGVFIIDEILDDATIESILTEICSLAENVVWPEVYDSLLDVVITHLEEESSKKASDRQQREMVKDAVADGYLVYNHFRNGFLDCDTKPKYATTLEQFNPKDVSWTRADCNDAFKVINEEGVEIIRQSGIAYVAIINEEDYIDVYIPIIKARKVVNGVDVGTNQSYTYNTNSNKWIPFADAKTLTDKMLSKFHKYSNTYTYDELHNSSMNISERI